jgi:hypothetical protein
VASPRLIESSGWTAVPPFAREEPETAGSRLRLGLICDRIVGPGGRLWASRPGEVDLLLLASARGVAQTGAPVLAPGDEDGRGAAPPRSGLRTSRRRSGGGGRRTPTAAAVVLDASCRASRPTSGRAPKGAATAASTLRAGFGADLGRPVCSAAASPSPRPLLLLAAPWPGRARVRPASSPWRVLRKAGERARGWRGGPGGKMADPGCGPLLRSLRRAHRGARAGGLGRRHRGPSLLTQGTSPSGVHIQTPADWRSNSAEPQRRGPVAAMVRFLPPEEVGFDSCTWCMSSAWPVDDQDPGPYGTLVSGASVTGGTDSAFVVKYTLRSPAIASGARGT